MNDPKKIPQWAVALMLTACGSLVAVTVTLITYIFVGVAGKVDEMEKAVTRMNQQMAVMQIQLDTQSKFCRFPASK